MRLGENPPVIVPQSVDQAIGVPPGVGFVTVTLADPTVVISLDEIVAVSWVAFTNVPRPTWRESIPSRSRNASPFRIRDPRS